MANKTGKGGFKKGKSGNPGGSKKIDPYIKEFKETSYLDFINHLQKYGAMNKTEMATEMNRPDATMFEIMFGNIIVNAAKGSRDARQVLLDRLWGKVKEENNLFDKLSQNELIALAKEALKVLDKDKNDKQV